MKCPPGYTGPDCVYTCIYPYYGEDCFMKCDCSADLCDFVSGCKLTTTTVTLSEHQATDIKDNLFQCGAFDDICKNHCDKNYIRVPITTYLKNMNVYTKLARKKPIYYVYRHWSLLLICWYC